MEYAITFADVMTGLIGIGLGIFGWLVKNWISGVLKSNEETKVQEEKEGGTKDVKEKPKRTRKTKTA